MAKIAFQLRLDEDTHRRIKAIAEKEMRSLNAQIEYMLLESIDRYEKAHGALEERQRKPPR